MVARPATRGVLLPLLLLVPSCPALQHSGMWGIGATNDSATAGWVTLTFESCSAAQILANFHASGAQALWPLQWTTARKEQCFAPVPHNRRSGCVQGLGLGSGSG